MASCLNKPAIWSFKQVLEMTTKKFVIWTIPQTLEKIDSKLKVDIILFPEYPDCDIENIVVIGGGVLIDTAKVWRVKKSPKTKLIVIPSIWGSGAENSPIAVLNEVSGKRYFIGDEYLPDVRVIWPSIVEGIDQNLLSNACGDVWAHALEGFCSPLADANTRSDLAGVINGIIDLPYNMAESWFEMSARACRGQANSSVGLIHGMAHVLEPILNSDNPNQKYGHAAICSTLLAPVLSFNLSSSTKCQKLFDEYHIDLEKVRGNVLKLFSQNVFNHLKPAFTKAWMQILRDPSSRTNSVLVKRDSLKYFEGYAHK